MPSGDPAYEAEKLEQARIIVGLTPLVDGDVRKMVTGVAALLDFEVDQIILECEEDPSLVAWYREVHVHHVLGTIEYECRHRLRNNIQNTTEEAIKILWGTDDADGCDEDDDVGYAIADAIEALWRIRVP